MYFSSFFFFFNDTATTEIYTLSLHDALPIYDRALAFGEVERRAHRLERQQDVREENGRVDPERERLPRDLDGELRGLDRKSTRLNSSHQIISYAVFCLKKKKNTQTHTHRVRS